MSNIEIIKKTLSTAEITLHNLKSKIAENMRTHKNLLEIGKIPEENSVYFMKKDSGGSWLEYSVRHRTAEDEIGELYYGGFKAVSSNELLKGVDGKAYVDQRVEIIVDINEKVNEEGIENAINLYADIFLSSMLMLYRAIPRNF